MSSKRRQQSSRANGAKSHGPVTAAGKFISSQNSTIHSFAAQTLVLTNESHDRFQSLFQSYQDELQPQSQIEMDLVEQMCVSKWRQRRLWTVESATLDLAMERQDEAISKEFESVDEPTRLAIAFQSTAESGAVALFHRYETSMRRSWDRALDRLKSIRAASPPARVLPGCFIRACPRVTRVPHPGKQADSAIDHPSDHAESPNEPSPINEQQT